MSTNSFGAVTWTDGVTTGAMIGDPTPFTRCSSCGEFYWVADARKVGRYNRYMDSPFGKGHTALPPDWLNAPMVTRPTEVEFHSALEAAGGMEPERLRYLRVMAWHRGNDAYRTPPGEERMARQEWSECYETNLEAFIVSLGSDQPEDMLMVAEALRELGRFEASLFQLRRLPADDLPQAKAYIVALSKARIRDVMPLPEPEEE